jgi:hypothetical protein
LIRDGLALGVIRDLAGEISYAAASQEGHKLAHGWLLREKVVKGCERCKKCDMIVSNDGASHHVNKYCTRELTESCGGPDWPCFESREA